MKGLELIFGNVWKLCCVWLFWFSFEFGFLIGFEIEYMVEFIDFYFIKIVFIGWKVSDDVDILDFIVEWVKFIFLFCLKLV